MVCPFQIWLDPDKRYGIVSLNKHCIMSIYASGKYANRVHIWLPITLTFSQSLTLSLLTFHRGHTRLVNTTAFFEMQTFSDKIELLRFLDLIEKKMHLRQIADMIYLNIFGQKKFGNDQKV